MATTTMIRMSKAEAKEQLRSEMKKKEKLSKVISKFQERKHAGKQAYILYGNKKIILDAEFFKDAKRTDSHQSKVVDKLINELSHAKGKRSTSLTGVPRKNTLEAEVLMSAGLKAFLNDPVFAPLGLSNEFYQGYAMKNAIFSLINLYIRVKGLRVGKEIMYDAKLRDLLNSTAVLTKVDKKYYVNTNPSVTVSQAIMANPTPGKAVGIYSDRMLQTSIMKIMSYTTISEKVGLELGLSEVAPLADPRIKAALVQDKSRITQEKARLDVVAPTASSLARTSVSRLSPTQSFIGQPQSFIGGVSPTQSRLSPTQSRLSPTQSFVGGLPQSFIGQPQPQSFVGGLSPTQSRASQGNVMF